MKKFLCISMVTILLFAMASCQKDQDMRTPDPGDSGDVQFKTSSTSILSTTSANQVPIQMFAVNPMYKTAYYHYKQPDGISCSWTSYVNCINCIVTANNNYCYSTAISTVKSRCQNYYPQASTNGSNSILALEWYAGKYDYNLINYNRKSTGNRWDATKNMLAHINSYHSPFVVISSMDNVGHFRVVFSIDWKQSETTSTVYYTDCWYPNTGSFNTNLRSMSLYQFLNLMTTNSAYYNMFFMWPK